MPIKTTRRYALDARHRSRASRTKSTLLATVISALCLSTAYADDTEVFFGQVDRTANNQPNVLFVLDTSGSMNRTDSQVSGNTTRLERMQEAMTTILNTSDNVNMGIMRFNGSNGGGSVLYPITSINEKICESNDCGEVNVIAKIAGSTDDVEETGTGAMSMAGNILSLQSSGSGDANRKIGLRFKDLNIPQGATILSASLGFIAQQNNNASGTETISIQAEQADNAATYMDAAFDASIRTYGTPVDWKPNRWTSGQLNNTVDLSAQVQEVVNRANWCGGNAMGFLLSGSADRDIVSYDASPANSPVLKVTYDSSSLPTGGGCAVKYAIAQVSSSYDDAEEQRRKAANPWSSDLELFVDNGRTQTIGMRFTDLQIPKNAEILESTISLKAISNSWGVASGTITGENADNPATYQRQRFNISRRPRTSASVEWDNLNSIQSGDVVVTPDISNIVSELTSRSAWESGNALSIIMDSKTTAGKVSVASYNYSPSDAPKLIIKYKSFIQPSTEEPTYITARDRLLNEVVGMTATGGTPVVDAYYEAAQYMLGGNVEYGKQRGRSLNRFHRVSHPLSYTGGSLFRPIGCDDSDPDDSDCLFERINGTAKYVSPMESSCQTNHIVLLSDGQATSNSAVTQVQAAIGKSCEPGNWKERCGVDLAEWLKNTDHSPSLQGEQKIKTYTIGFNIDHPFLNDIASNGNGRYFRADSAADLVARFEDILSDVYSVDTSFVAPGATVNQFNRLTHRSDIYFALFKPEESPTWSGNLKKYQVGLTEEGVVTIFDHGNPKKDAIDKEEGFFASNAKSDWSTSTDGHTVAAGGAAEMLSKLDTSGTGLSSRKLYTILSDMSAIPSDGIDILSQGDLIHEDNTNIDDADLGISESDANVDDVEIELPNLLKWARGIDVKDEDEDGDTDDWREHLGDPMHSRPVIMNYAGTPDPYTTIFLGTNEGMLHAVNNVDGEELFAFMPKSLLPNIKSTFINSTGTRHPYGLDGPMTTWTIDANNNVVVDSNETAMLFLGMRRGGSNYYAFDISKRTEPKLKWVIQGGENSTPGFEELGQSWSRMVPTKIRYRNETRNVVIFGGGYDESNDVDYSIGAVPKTEDTSGRAIFIVDAETGELIYQIGASDTNADLKRNDMKYAIPSDVRVLDIDGNGYADSLFVGDMGGQIWRFDFDLYHNTGDLLQGDVLANLGASGANNVTNNRRFFYEPDIALIREDGERYLSISIGSGWRSHPLNTEVNDEFYVLRSYDVYNMPEGYGKQDTNGNFTPITRGDLTDVTNDLHPSVSNHGWRMSLNNPGEKVLGDALTVNGQIVFTSYLPEESLVACSSALGSGAVYAMRVSDGRPSLDLDDDGDLTDNDRRDVLKHGGLPPEATALIVEGNVVDTDGNISTIIKPTILVGPEQPLDGLFDTNLTQREFWLDAGMTRDGARGANIDARNDTTTAETQTD